MADGSAPTGWDVVSETGVGQTPPTSAPAQPGGWNVVSQLVPPAPQPESPGRDLLGAAEIGGAADVNALSAIPNGLYDLYQRIVHGNANAPAPIPYIHPGAAGQQFAQEAGADPVLQQILGRPIAAVVNAVQSHLSPQGTVAGDVERLAPGAVQDVLGAAAAPSVARAAAAAPGDVAAAASGVRALTGGTAADVGGEPTAADIGLHAPNNPPLTPTQHSADVVAANEAGIQSPEIPLSQQTLNNAITAPASVYTRLGNAIPGGQLSGAGADLVRSAGMPEGGRVTAGSPQAQTQIENLRQQLLAPVNAQGQPWTGQNWVNEMRALRQEGYTNIASDDVSNQQLGKAQLDMARGVEQFVGDSIPPNSDVSLQQFQDARQQLAKNANVQAALRGNSVDLGALARIQRNDPELLTGGLKTLADFAFENPEATRFSNRFQPSIIGALSDFSFTRPGSWVQPAIAAGSRLVNNARSAAAADAANRLFPPVPAERFGPIEPPPPTAPNWSTAPGAGGVAAPENNSDLATVLAEGLERPPPAELSAGPMTAPQPNGIPFTQNAGHLAGDLGLAPEDSWFTGAAPNNSDLAKVMSQGVPEGIVTRTAPGVSNNASGQTAASQEAINAVHAQKAAGIQRFRLDENGAPTPLTGIESRDPRSLRGQPVIDVGPDGKPIIVDRGGLSPLQLRGLLARFAAKRDLGIQF